MIPEILTWVFAGIVVLTILQSADTLQIMQEIEDKE